jgi:hypothetical protein
MGETSSMSETAVLRQLRGVAGELTEDEAALVRTLTPATLDRAASVEHLFDLVDLLSTIRADEAVAEYVFAIAPGWDGSIETLLLGARVTTAYTRHELERRLPALIG